MIKDFKMNKSTIVCALILLAGCGKKNQPVVPAPQVIEAPVLDRPLLEELYGEHVAQLSYKELHHAPFVIAFSAVPGMGKSFLSEKLAE